MSREYEPAVGPAPTDVTSGCPIEAVGEVIPDWVGSLRGQIWIAPDMDAAEASIAREMGA